MMWIEPVNTKKGHRLLYAAVFFCFFVLYAATAQRGVSWQDSGEYQYRILTGDYLWNSGIARAHPLYILMAQGFSALFPKAACFSAVNLFSGLGLALALALLANNVMRLTRSVWAAALAVSVLGFAQMTWWLGTIAEVYTWSLAFLMAEVLCLIRYSENRDNRWLVALFGVNGLHFGVHNAALLGLPVYAFLLLSALKQKEKRIWAAVCGCAVFWLLGSGMVVWQAIRLLTETGSPMQVLKSVLFGDGYELQVLGIGGFQFKSWAANMILASVSFVNPCWVFAGRGLLLREANGNGIVRNWLLALTLLHGLFWVRYFVPDQATFVLPTLGLLAVWVGLGAGRSALVRDCVSALAGRGEVLKCESSKVREFGDDIGLRANPALVGMLAVGVACAVAGPWLLCEVTHRTGLTVSRSRMLPFRDELGYWLKPWKQAETSASKFVGEIGRTLRAGDVLLADATVTGPLLAAREAGVLSKEWRLITPWSGESDGELRALVQKGQLRVYVVSPVIGYAPQAVLEEAAGFEKQGVVFRAIGDRQSAKERPDL